MSRLGIILAIVLTTTVAHGGTALTAPQQTEMVNAHNRWRRQVGVTPLRWAADLGEVAQHWAEHLRDSNDCNMVHSGASKLGENLHWESAVQWSDGRTERQEVTPTQATAGWGAEKADYDYATNRCASGKVCGHYTQMVGKAAPRWDVAWRFAPMPARYGSATIDRPATTWGGDPIEVSWERQGRQIQAPLHAPPYPPAPKKIRRLTKPSLLGNYQAKTDQGQAKS
ncbi:MAG: hypothetical protein HGA96_05130 [Desulfobulbaceae bacterium]|nr:hypothetical protein [Desulfobulbaceae bacterium]